MSKAFKRFPSLAGEVIKHWANGQDKFFDAGRLNLQVLTVGLQSCLQISVSSATVYGLAYFCGGISKRYAVCAYSWSPDIHACNQNQFLKTIYLPQEVRKPSRFNQVFHYHQLCVSETKAEQNISGC